MDDKNIKYEKVPDAVYKSVFKLYNKNYFQKHSGDLINIFLIITAIFLGISYNYIKINSKSIQNNWNEEKCKPSVMPFAGIIMPEGARNGESASEFTLNNFKHCMNNIFSDIAKDSTAPINYVTSTITEIFEFFTNIINYIRQFVNYLREAAQNIFQEIMGKLLNVFVQLQQFMISMKDFFAKIQGIMTSTLYMSISVYYTMKSSIGAFYELIVIILLIMAAIILILWIIPFTWGAAAAGLVIFLAISIPLGIIAAVMAEAFDLSLSGMPGAPTCFGENTTLEMNNGEFKNIKSIKNGDILKNNNKVISTFKCLSRYENFYKINNTIVSGSHYIIENNRIIRVSNYQHAVPIIYNSEFTYCLTTEQKKININNDIFLDFDDLSLDFINLFKANNIKINKIVDAGIDKNSKIKMEDGTNKRIKDIKLGDKLYDNTTVLGIVNLNNNNVINNYCVLPNGSILSENNILLENNNEVYLKETYESLSILNDLEVNNTLYHLVTSSRYFYIGDIKIVHYSDLIDIYIKKYFNQ